VRNDKRIFVIQENPQLDYERVNSIYLRFYSVPFNLSKNGGFNDFSFKHFLLEEMSVILGLVWFNIIIEVVVNKDDVGRGLRPVEALPHDLEDDVDAAVQGRQVRLQEDRGHRVARQGPAHCRGKVHRAGVVGEQHCQSGFSNHAALVQRSQDGHFVVFGFAEAPAVVEVDGERIVPEGLECLEVVPIHVPDHEIKHRQIYHVQQSSAMVVRVYIFNSITVIVVQFPARLPPLMVTSPPGVPPSFPWRNFF